MKVNGLDHVNVITADLDATARFYEDLLGLERRDGPAPLTPQTAQWMYDAAGRPVLHLNSEDCPRTFDRVTCPGPTGAVHHIALNCSGYDALIDRLNVQQAVFQCNTVAAIGLRQVFVMDPNQVLLELNFFGD